MACQKQHKFQRSRMGMGVQVDTGMGGLGTPTALWARVSARYCRWYSWRRAHAEKGVSCGVATGATHWRK